MSNCHMNTTQLENLCRILRCPTSSMLSCDTITTSKYSFTVIGMYACGRFGCVLRIRFDGNIYALKLSRDRLDTEVRFMERCRRIAVPIISSVFTLSEYTDVYGYIMKPIDGTLFSLWPRLSHLGKYGIDCGKILNYLRQQRIVHNDMHLENIVLRSNRLEVIDFGYALKGSKQTKAAMYVCDIVHVLSDAIHEHSANNPFVLELLHFLNMTRKPIVHYVSTSFKIHGNVLSHRYYDMLSNDMYCFSPFPIKTKWPILSKIAQPFETLPSVSTVMKCRRRRPHRTYGTFDDLWTHGIGNIDTTKLKLALWKLVRTSKPLCTSLSDLTFRLGKTSVVVSTRAKRGENSIDTVIDILISRTPKTLEQFVTFNEFRYIVDYLHLKKWSITH